MNYIGRDPAPGSIILVGDTNPVGMIGWFHAVPDGSWLRLNGQFVLKASYPDLWTYAQGFLTADQVVNPGLYKSIDAATLALPKLDGLFVRGAGAYDGNRVAAALGVFQGDANLSHFHLPSDGSGFQTTAAGPAWGSSVTGATSAASTNAVGGPEARPANVALIPCVKARSTVLMPSAPLPLPPGQTGFAGPTVTALAGTFVEVLLAKAGVREITVGIRGLSTNGGSLPMVQLGTAAGIENAGYESNCFGSTNAGLIGTIGVNNATGLLFGTSTTGAAAIWNGTMKISMVDSADNSWAATGTYTRSGEAVCFASAGSKALAGLCDRIRITMVNGTDVFDAGKVGVICL